MGNIVKNELIEALNLEVNQYVKSCKETDDFSRLLLLADGDELVEFNAVGRKVRG